MGASCVQCSLEKQDFRGISEAASSQANVLPPVSPMQESLRSPKQPTQVIIRQARANLLVKNGGFALKNFALANQGKVEDFYTMHEICGEGAFGSVRRAQDQRTQMWVAVKSIPKRLVNEACLQKELRIMSLLDHPNIIRLHETFEDATRVLIVMELCNGGELFDHICRSGSFTEDDVARCVQQMMLAVNYLHQNMIIHRDLKPQNFLLSRRVALLQATIKLIDFGISRSFQHGETLSSKRGTPVYLAPEVLSGGYTSKADIWSLGVIMHIMISGEAPFSGDTVAVFVQIKSFEPLLKGEPWDRISEEATSFLRSLLTRNPAFRPSAAESLRHAWLNSETNLTLDQKSPKESGKKKRGDGMTKLEVKRLKAYGNMHNLKKAALTVIATQLDPKAIDSLRKTFVSMDRNKDGVVSAMELREGLLRAGVAAPDNLQELFSNIDTDGSGAIDYTEFLASTLDKKKYFQEEVVWSAFKKFDLDGNGEIDIKELDNVLGTPDVRQALHLDVPDGISKVEELFAKVDKNKDGRIDFNEFMAMITTKKSSDEENEPPASRFPDLGCRTCLTISRADAKDAVSLPKSTVVK